MTNVPLMFQPLFKYAEFNGRSRRSEFWLWILFRILLGMVLGIGALAWLAPVLPQVHDHPEMFLPRYFTVWPSFTLINLALFIPTLAVGVRRLHDINRSGWWIIMPIVVAMVGVTVFMIVIGVHMFQVISAHPNGDLSDKEGLSLVFGVFGYMFLFVFLPVLISQIVMLVFYVTEGTRGPNRFGNDPKGGARVTADTFA
jgi:uncharacterized membrane protein YhaH (DUF805 family)